MWGLRVIRVGVVMCGLLALSAGSGCCDCCQNLWKTKSAPPAKTETAQEEKTIQNEWKTWWFEDQPAHLTPERIKGGIY